VNARREKEERRKKKKEKKKREGKKWDENMIRKSDTRLQRQGSWNERGRERKGKEGGGGGKIPRMVS